MSDTGFAVAFFVGLVLLAVLAGSGFSLFGNVATSTPAASTPAAQRNTSISQSPYAAPSSQSSQFSQSSQSSQPTANGQQQPRLSNEEIERRVAQIFRDLDRLSEEIRVLKLAEPASPFVDTVNLSVSSARSTNPENEYLTITAKNSNAEAVNISDWYLESYVTENRAAIPDAARILDRFRSNKESPVLLEPGQRAYLHTAEPPLNVSFHENMCTGYLTAYGSFNPSLSYSCPDPKQEMLRFANIDLDNDNCYDFVERIPRCKITDEDVVQKADLSNACKKFINDNLTYDGCVDNHRFDPFFDNVGTWRLYLDRDEELWRSKREIIRLLDGNDRVVDVIEY